MEPDTNYDQNQVNVIDTTNPSPSTAISDTAASTSVNPQTLETQSPSEKPAKKISSTTIILLLILLVVIITAFIVIYMYLRTPTKTYPTDSSQAQNETFTFKAKVEYLTGTAYKLVEDRKVEILEGDILGDNDVIQTDTNSRIVLSLDDESVIRMDSETELELNLLTPSLTSIINKEGVVFVRVNKDESHAFRIVAGDFSFEAVGTAYSVENRDEIKVKVFENEVKVKIQNKEETKLTVNQEWSSTEKQVMTMNINTVQANDFYKWSLSEEKLAQSTTPTSAPKSTTTPIKEKQETQTGKYIELSGTYSSTDGGIKLQWKAVGIDTSQGFKVIKNLSGNPVYPGDEAKFVGNNNNYYFWQINDGKTWHFRVCQYKDGKCELYSNELEITSGTSSSSGETRVSSITLKAQKSGDNSATLSWTKEGSTLKGFKVIWSTNQNPTFPPRDGDWWSYYPNPDSNSAEVGGLESGKTYYFRVCEYLGGSCGIYSNQVTLSY